MTYKDDLKAAMQSKLEMLSNKKTDFTGIATTGDITYPTRTAVKTELDKKDVTITESAGTGDILKTYTVKQGTTSVGSIDVPKDFLLKSASVKLGSACVPAQTPADHYFMDLVFNTKDGSGTDTHQFVDMNTLVKTYTFTDGTTIDFTVSGYDVTAEVIDESIVTVKLADGAVTSVKIGTKEVKTSNIDDAAVTNPKLATDAVETANIKDANVTLDKMAANSVNSSKVVDGSLTGTDCAKDTITGGSAASAGNIAADTVHWYNCNDDVEQHIFESLTTVVNSLP